jgi:hypothetical protein
MTPPPRVVVRAALERSGVDFTEPRPGAFLAQLPGERKLLTTTWLVVGAHSLLLEAFVVRHPEENPERFYRFLLERNAHTYGVHFAVDAVGDVFLTGRVPLAAVTEAEVDRLLGCVLSYADENFNVTLEIGFPSSIRREWSWRVTRGESLAHLASFAHFADPQRNAED